MQDPYVAVKDEVEHSVSVVVELHKKWASLNKGDEFDWTSTELLSGLRSIEWDLQDLEDTVSIVEGNRTKFKLEESDVQDRKHFIETTRQQIVSIRDEVQGQRDVTGSGYCTGMAKSALPSMSKGKGYGKVGLSEEPIPPADDDIESGAKPSSQAVASDAADEIIGADLDVGVAESAHGRHRKKKACLSLSILLLLMFGVVATLYKPADQVAALTTTSNITAAVEQAE